MLMHFLIFLVAFLLGSIPFGVFVAKLGFGKDIRKMGSGNIGTSNAVRTLGIQGGAVVFFFDTLKGYLGGLCSIVLLTVFTGGSIDWGYVWHSIIQPVAPLANASTSGTALVGVVAGHLFSPWLGFKGGKGIGPAGGNLFVLFGWALGAFMLAVFVVSLLVGRYASLASMIAATVCVVVSVVLYHGNPYTIGCAAVAWALVVWAHRGNIKRLLNGTESGLGKRKK